MRRGDELTETIIQDTLPGFERGLLPVYKCWLLTGLRQNGTGAQRARCARALFSCSSFGIVEVDPKTQQ